jgi:uncharacterized radical SAM protein YgiQ
MQGKQSQSAKPLYSYRKYWAECFGTAPFLPMSRQEMEHLGWDSCDIIIVTGDAYVDHASFGMAVIGRLLEAQGFRVGIISQPDWSSAEPFKVLGRPNLFFGITAGNMDSMINRYTADHKLRHDDAYTPNNEGGKRPDRSVLVYSQRCREAYKGVALIIGGIEASLRRIAHYDYWSDKVRRSVLLDSKADMLIFGNGDRAIVEIAHRLASGGSVQSLRDIRGTAFVCSKVPEEYIEVDSTRVDLPSGGASGFKVNPYEQENASKLAIDDVQPVRIIDDNTAKGIFAETVPGSLAKTGGQVIRLPSYEKVRSDKVLYAHTSRILHKETNPGNARPLIQAHGDRHLWLNPPPIPLTTEEMDWVFELPYQRTPHPLYGNAKIPAYEMIRFSVNIMRGCFGGCTFCSITEHEGRIIQNRSEASILREIETIRDNTPGFTGTISDLGGPTANMWRLACKDKKIESSCKRLSCIYPSICSNLNTDHTPLISLYRKARSLPGVKRVLIASGLRYDLAVKDPEYVRELVTHHVGGYLKIAPEHTEAGPLSKMMKPGIGAYDQFREMFDRFSREAGKDQYLIPYFIAAHPGTTTEDMMNLAIWLKRNNFEADQVQNFFPSPMSTATAMYHGGRNPLHRVNYKSEKVFTAKGLRARRLHKAFLRYHDPHNWKLLRATLKDLGRGDLIGSGRNHLIPAGQPGEKTGYAKSKPKPNRTFRTQHVRKRS